MIYSVTVSSLDGDIFIILVEADDASLSVAKARGVVKDGFLVVDVRKL